MNRLVFIALIWLGGSFPSWAQLSSDVNPKPPLGPGPLIARCPNFAQWRITFTFKATPQSPSPDHPAPPTVPHLSAITVTKTGKIYHQETLDDRGGQTDKWWVDGVQGTRTKPSKLFVMSTNQDLFYLDYGASDFPELNWVDAGSYAGVQKDKDKEVLVFSKSVAPEVFGPLVSLSKIPNQPPTDLTLWIDSQTRLPVQLITPEATEVYEFLVAPDTALSPPPELLKTIKALKEQVAHLTSPWPTP